MPIIISVILTLGINAAGILITKKRFKDKVEYSVKKRNAFIIISTALSVMCGILLPLCAAAEEWTIFLTLRTASVICWTFFAAVIDYKIKIIPNELVVGMLIELILIFIPEALSDLRGFKSTIVMSLLGGLIMGGIFLLGRGISKGGMGMGDVKLITVCGLFLGMDSVVGMIFWALLFSIITGIALMIAKKAKLKTKLAMGPFFFAGAVVSHTVLFLGSVYGG